MQEKLFLYYTSDLHSHFENWPQIIGYVDQKARHHRQKKENYWLIDNGDHVDRFHPIAEGLKGKGNVELLNEAGYSVANIGNNEGITLKREDLFHLYDEANFGITCANLHNDDGEDPDWLKPYQIVTSDQGTKIGIIGLTAPFQTFYAGIGWRVEPPFDVLEQFLPELRASCEIVVVLSHLGINEDEEMARRYEGIDLIIGGHTHHLFQNGEMVEGALLTAAGKHGTHLGEVMIVWDREEKRVIRKEAHAVPTESLKKDLRTTKQLSTMRKKAVAQLQEVITELDAPMRVAWFQETELMRKLTEELRDWTGADVAMLNAGVLLDHLRQGSITYEDVHRICPHPMNPCKVVLKGNELVEVIRVAHTKKLTEIRLKGFGFRGEVIGKMVFDGVDIVTEELEDGEPHIRKVLLGGTVIDGDKNYTLATADTFTFGRLFPEIAYAKEKKYYMPEFLRDLLAKTLKK